MTAPHCRLRMTRARQSGPAVWVWTVFTDGQAELTGASFGWHRALRNGCDALRRCSGLGDPATAFLANLRQVAGDDSELVARIEEAQAVRTHGMRWRTGPVPQWPGRATS